MKNLSYFFLTLIFIIVSLHSMENSIGIIDEKQLAFQESLLMISPESSSLQLDDLNNNFDPLDDILSTYIEQFEYHREIIESLRYINTLNNENPKDFSYLKNPYLGHSSALHCSQTPLLGEAVQLDNGSLAKISLLQMPLLQNKQSLTKKLNPKNGSTKFMKESKYECNKCNQLFSIQKMAAHIAYEEGTRDYACEDCKLAYNKRNYVRHEKEVHHRDASHLYQYQCSTCDQIFNVRHKKAHLAYEEGSLDYRCDDCRLAFTGPHYRDHMVWIHSGNNISLVDNLFISKNVVPARTSNSRQKVSWKCPICQQAFPLNHKQAHEAYHENNRFFKCEDCKIALSKSNYIKHMASQHNKDESHLSRYECNACNLVFSSRFKKAHIAYDEDSLKYKCLECKVAFNKANYKKHIQIYHEKMDEDSNSCLSKSHLVPTASKKRKRSYSRK